MAKKVAKVPNLRFKGFEGDWELKSMADIATIGRGRSRHRPRDAKFLYGGKYPFIQTGDIREADLFITDSVQTYSEEGLKQSKLWPKDTLCITIAANIAESAILKIAACFPDSIVGLIPKNRETPVLFVKYLFDRFKTQIQSLSEGVAQGNLNQDKLSKLKFHFPTHSEQKKIEGLLSAIDFRIQTQSKIIQDFSALKAALSKRIFSQELQFPEFMQEWELKRLKDICKLTKGEQVNKNDLLASGAYPCQNGGVNPSGYTERYNSDENTITVSEGGNSCGYIKLMKTKFWLGGHCYKIKLRGSINQNYFYQLLKFNEKKVMRLRVGSGLPNIQQKSINNFEVSLSNSLKEQIKIAESLFAIERMIELELAALDLYYKLKVCLMQRMFI